MLQSSVLDPLLDLFRGPQGEGPVDLFSLVLWGAAGLVVLLFLVWLLRILFRRKPRTEDWDRDLRIELDTCPMPANPPEGRRLTVYHIPVRLRLVVVAPAGKEYRIDPLTVEQLLDRVLPGLGAVAEQDRPHIRVWPTQVSYQGFLATFHRNTPKAAHRGEPSRWVLVSGRALVGRQHLLLGLGLWADEPNALDRINLEGNQWLDVLRLKDIER